MRVSRASANWTYFWIGSLAACAILLAKVPAQAQGLTPAWVELGEDGKAVARIVVSNPQDCPAIQIDGASRPMSPRQPMPAGLRPACEFAIPAGAPGETLLAVRCTNTKGEIQPDAPNWNPSGFMRNSVERLSVTVA